MGRGVRGETPPGRERDKESDKEIEKIEKRETDFEAKEGSEPASCHDLHATFTESITHIILHLPPPPAQPACAATRPHPEKNRGNRRLFTTLTHLLATASCS